MKKLLIHLFIFALLFSACYGIINYHQQEKEAQKKENRVKITIKHTTPNQIEKTVWLEK